MSPERVDATPNSGKPGAILARERAAQGLSVDQVADQLKLAPRQIVALEKDDLASLPGMAVVRGFVRAYAKHLKLDPAPLVAMIAVESGLGENSAMRRDIATPFSETRMPSMSRRSMTPLWVGGSALMLGIIVVLAYMQLTGKWPASLNNLSKVENSAGTHSASASASVDAVSDAIPAVPASATATTSSDATSPNAGVVTSVLPSPVIASAPSAPMNDAITTTPNGRNLVTAPNTVPSSVGAINPNSPTLSATNPSVAVNAGSPSNVVAAPVGNNTLVLRLKQDSWVEVKRSNGQVMVARLLKAGSAETIDMSSPVVLVVGNVNAVEANLRGTNLNLKSGTGNTARLNLK